MNLFKRIMALYNRLPFGGKLATRPLTFAVFTATGIKKIFYAILAGIILGIFVYGHGKQALMGLAVIFRATNIIFIILALIYFLANALAVVAQLYLFVRILRNVCNAKKNKKMINPHCLPQYTGKEKLIMFVVTLGGQIAFSYIFLRSM